MLTNATASESVGEGVETVGLDAAEAIVGKPAWFSSLREDVDRQVEKPALKVNIKLTKATGSSSSIAPSPRPADGCQNMQALKTAIEKEKEEKRKNEPKGEPQHRQENKK